MEGNKNENEVRYSVLSKKEFDKIFNSGGGRRNKYDKLKEIFEKEKAAGSECILMTFDELSEVVGCKASSGSARNVQQYIKENMQDLVKKVTVSTQEKLIGFVLK